MSRMIRKPGGALGVVLALGALAAVLPSTPAAGQQERTRVRTERTDCRCVDRDGTPIEKCTCFVMPDVQGMVLRSMAPFQGRARLGVTLDSEGSGQGARVASVLEDGPADEAGIREGDVITRVNGNSLLEPLGADVERDLDEDGSLPVQRLMALVRDIEPGEDVSVEYLRDGERRTVTLEARELDGWTFSLRSPEAGTIVLGDRLRGLHGEMGALRGELEGLRLRTPRGGEIRIWSDSTRPRMFSTTPGEGTFFYRTGGEDGVLDECPSGGDADRRVMIFSGRCIGGIELVELNPGLGDYFGAAQGVLVADVHPDSKLGLRPGDVILSVGDREADDPDRVRRILGSYGAEENISFRIMRQRRETSVQGTLAR